MSNLFGIFGVGLSSLRAAQFGIQVAGDNIANVNTPGFARRRADLRSGLSLQVAGGQVGIGVQVAGIQRITDNVLQAAVERQKGEFGYFDEQLRGMSQLEFTFGSIQGDSLATRYAEFSASFRTLASNPSDPTLRSGAVGAASTLAADIRSRAQQITTQRQQEDQSIRSTVGQVNELAEQLAQLNKQIVEADPQFAGGAALEDQRTIVVEQLRELTGGSSFSDEAGQTQFILPGGGSLVTAQRSRPLSVSTGTDGMGRVELAGGDVTGQLNGGRIGALLDLRDSKLPARLDALNELATDLTTRVNAITTSGQDGGTPPQPGTALFVPNPADASNAALSIGVSSAISQDASLLAISSDGAAGNGDLATAIADLIDEPSGTLGNRSPDQFLADLYAGVGQDVAQADAGTGTSLALLEASELRRDQASGVSLDEEAVDLLKFQRTYEAAARFINTVNELTAITVELGR